MKKRDPIIRRKLSHEVRDRLLEMITSGELGEGDQMPSEHELMERFEVGRPAVREAMQALETMGLITIQHGEKARIKKPTAEDVLGQIDSATRHLLASSSQNVEHLKEARQVFEAGVVFLAAQRATAGDIRKLKKKLEQMRQCKDDRPKFLIADQDFHTTISEISGNPIFAAVSQALFKWLSEYHTSLLGVAGLEDLTLKEHEAIFERITARDARGAANKISEHILRVNELYKNYE